MVSEMPVSKGISSRTAKQDQANPGTSTCLRPKRSERKPAAGYVPRPTRMSTPMLFDEPEPLVDSTPPQEARWPYTRAWTQRENMWVYSLTGLLVGGIEG